VAVSRPLGTDPVRGVRHLPLRDRPLPGDRHPQPGTAPRHCEAQSAEAIRMGDSPGAGLLRYARNDGGPFAMTVAFM
jgi:hypothetical protein